MHYFCGKSPYTIMTILHILLLPDPSDSDLRTVLVHLVAVTIGCSKSSHLWYSIFQLGELINTYISGFMVSGWGLGGA
jgi:hypothetical protein